MGTQTNLEIFHCSEKLLFDLFSDHFSHLFTLSIMLVLRDGRHDCWLRDVLRPVRAEFNMTSYI